MRAASCGEAGPRALRLEDTPVVAVSLWAGSQVEWAGKGQGAGLATTVGPPLIKRLPNASPVTAKALSDLISRGFSGRFLLFL